MYESDTITFRRDINRVYEFEKKRASFGLTEINEKFIRGSTEFFVLTAYVAPRELNNAESLKLEQIKSKDPSYYAGVTKGWSILVTGRNTQNMVILPGKRSCQELSARLSDEFWDENKNITFKYLNGQEMVRKRVL